MKKDNNNLDTPTIINSIVDFLQDPDCKSMHETYEKTRDPCALLNTRTGPNDNQIVMHSNQGGTVTIINPHTFIRLPAEVNTDGNIPVVVSEAAAAATEVQDEQQLPVSVVQASSRKRTIMTRSLSRQASQVDIKEEEPEQEDSDSDYMPEPVAKKSRVSNSTSGTRVRSLAGRKPNSVKGDGLDHLPQDERDKVRQRRQKNKEAAARCRQKRVDLTNTLAQQVEAEQASKSKLQQEIRKLRAEHEKLKRQLEAHRAYGCNLTGTVGQNNTLNTVGQTMRNAMPQPAAPSGYQHSLPPPSTPAGTLVPIPVAIKSQPVIVEAANAPYQLQQQVHMHQPLTKPKRPQTLGLTGHNLMKQQANPDKYQIKMEELETPSKMIAMNPLFDGFTPTSIFGNIPSLNTPTCSAQQHRTISDQDLTTPCNEGLTSLTAL